VNLKVKGWENAHEQISTTTFREAGYLTQTRFMGLPVQQVISPQEASPVLRFQNSGPHISHKGFPFLSC
jgi:hypothetical protein